MIIENPEIRQLPLSLASCRRQVDSFLQQFELKREQMEYYAGVFVGEEMLAGGGYNGNIIKCIAADERARGHGLINILITHLRSQMRGRGNLFLYTKPENRDIFESMAFYTIGTAEKALLLETDKNAAQDYFQKIYAEAGSPGGKSGAIVMNCNPFTLGHLYLIETAATQCDHLFILVVREDRSEFSFDDRLRLVCQGCGHIGNVSVHSGGEYVISDATFPTYFLKTMEDAVYTQTALDIDVFAGQIAPSLNISARFAGEEPLDPVTHAYNDAMQRILPDRGVEVHIIPRKIGADGQPISASRVRQLLHEGRTAEVRLFVPDSTYEYLTQLKK